MMGALARRQAGFGLIETLIALGILAAASPVIASGISQMLRGAASTKVQVVSVQELQLATEWFLRDVARASTAEPLSGTSASATFTWWDGVDSRSCAYSLAGSLLQRQCGAETTTVGRDISAVLFTRVSDRVMKVDIAALPPGASAPKPGSIILYMRGK